MSTSLSRFRHIPVVAHARSFPSRCVAMTPHSLVLPRLKTKPVTKFQASTADEIETKEIQDADYSSLQRNEVWLVSTGEKVDVTSLWKATETCVLVFARSMGCVFCQEYARQLKRDVLPVFSEAGIRLYLVSVGTKERGIEFSELTEFPASQLLADPENVLYDAVGFIRTIQNTFFDVRTPLAIFGRALKKDRGGDLVQATLNWKPWIPPKGEQALQQGGVLVFKGKTCVFKRVDPATGNHLDLDELIRIAREASLTI